MSEIVSRRVLNTLARTAGLSVEDKTWLIGWWRQYAALYPTRAHEMKAFSELAEIFAGKRAHDSRAARTR